MTPRPRIRLGLADGHALTLAGMEQLFEAHDDLRVVWRAQRAGDALEALHREPPDVLIFDVTLRGGDGLDLARAVMADGRPTRTVLLTAAVDADLMEAALEAGVTGVMLKEMPGEQLVLCVRKVHAGQRWFEVRAAGHLLDKLVRRQLLARQLTRRELQTMRLAALGMANKRIAEELSVQEGTVKLHLHHVYAKLQLPGRQALTRFAHLNGVV